MKEKLAKNRHFLLLLYFPFYIAAFTYLETHVPDKIHMISCSLDQYIPFVEYFIVPYLLWFAYLGAAGLFFLFREKKMFVKMMCFGMIGMTTFLLVSWLYPNGLDLRPDTITRDNIFMDLTRMIWSVDVDCNVLPSIHVFNSVGMYLCITKSEKLKNRKGIRYGALLLTILIILSTVFLKQHSLVDVVTALLLCYVSYDAVFTDHLANLVEMLRRKPGTGRHAYHKKIKVKAKAE